MTQLSLDGDSLVGAAWDHARHGHCVVIAVQGEIARIQVDGSLSFQMQWPVALVRQTLASPQREEWVSVNGRDFVNRTEHLRLAGLGVVPLDPEIAQTTASPGRSSVESRVVRDPDEGAVMTVASAKNPARAKKGGGLASLSKTALRKKLLETVTIPDGAWASYRQEHGLPDREPGETREAFIKRVLA